MGRALPLPPRITPVPEPAPALAQVLAAPWVPAGRFRRIRLPDGAACAPLALDPRRIGPVAALRTLVPAPGSPSPAAAFRLATALRQNLWRRLRHVRGLMPAASVQGGEGGWVATLWACQGHGTLASPDTLDALAEIMEDAALRHSLAWACRAMPRSPRSSSSEGA